MHVMMQSWSHTSLLLESLKPLCDEVISWKPIISLHTSVVKQLVENNHSASNIMQGADQHVLKLGRLLGQKYDAP